jgi:hypothetical protein
VQEKIEAESGNGLLLTARNRNSHSNYRYTASPTTASAFGITASTTGAISNHQGSHHRRHDSYRTITMEPLTMDASSNQGAILPASLSLAELRQEPVAIESSRYLGKTVPRVQRLA